MVEVPFLFILFPCLFLTILFSSLLPSQKIVMAIVVIICDPLWPRYFRKTSDSTPKHRKGTECVYKEA